MTIGAALRHAARALLVLAGFIGTAQAAAPANDDDAAHQVLVMLQLPPAHFRPDSSYAGGYGDGMGRTARRGVAQQIAREHGLTLVSAWPMPVLGVDCYVLDVPRSEAPERIAQALEHDRRIAWAQPMHVYEAQARHTDPLYASQPAAGAWRLADLHTVATGRNVRVAVVDSGVDTSHPDLAGQVARNENFVAGSPPAAERHGTAVAGIIAARSDDGVGIAGVAPGARLLALRACRETSTDATLCTSLSLAQALHFAIGDDAQVINLSLSGPDDRLLGALIDAALARRINVVAAVDPKRADGGFPASHPGVLAVGDALPLPPHALLAPGRDVPASVPGARWEVLTGSSYASAHVAGLVAMLRELGTAGPAVAAALVRAPDGGIDTCATLLRAAAPRAGAGACAAGVPDASIASRH
jgi:hypothetical protein